MKLTGYRSSLPDFLNHFNSPLFGLEVFLDGADGAAFGAGFVVGLDFFLVADLLKSFHKSLGFAFILVVLVTETGTVVLAE